MVFGEILNDNGFVDVSFFNPFLRNFFSFGISLIPLLTQHPVMLRKTVGKQGYVI